MALKRRPRYPRPETSLGWARCPREWGAEMVKRLRTVVAAGLLGLAPSVGALPAHAQITFADIYAAPDDQDLNLAYARQQAEAGELLGATAALERMLYSNPDWDSARLFYAALLLRLDDRQGAQRELRLLEGRPLPAEQRAEVASLSAQLSGERASAVDEVAGWSGQLSVSARYDDNAGGVFGDVLFGSADQPDESVVLRAQVRHDRPVGNGVTGFAKANMALRRHEDVSEADYSVYSAAIGARGGEAWTWSVEAGADFVDISSESFLDQFGLRGRVGRRLGERATLSLQAGWHDQDFNSIAADPSGSKRTGDLVDIGPELDLRPTNTTRLVVSALYQDKSARSDGVAYDGLRLNGMGRWQFSPDAYVSASGTLRELDYKEDSVFLFPADNRADDILRLRAALGVRGSALLGNVPGMDDITFEVALNHLERDSNIPGSGFDTTGGEFRLVFDF